MLMLCGLYIGCARREPENCCGTMTFELVPLSRVAVDTHATVSPTCRDEIAWRFTD